MKTPEQLMTEWAVLSINMDKLTYDVLKKLIAEAMQVGVANEAELIQGALNEGIFCPFCGQLCKLHPRTMNANIARFMISLVKLFDQTEDWVYYRDCDYGGRDYPFAKDFGLAVMASRDDKTPDRGRVRGYWKPTDLGRGFVHDSISVPKQVFVFDNKVGKISPESSNITEALGTKFDFKELMSS